VANETIYWDDYRHENTDGTVTEVERSIRLNGDVSEMVHVVDSDGSHVAVWHVVHDAQGRLIHLDEKFMRLDSTLLWPPEGYRR
jgi:hypothetical protein